MGLFRGQFLLTLLQNDDCNHPVDELLLNSETRRPRPHVDFWSMLGFPKASDLYKPDDLTQHVEFWVMYSVICLHSSEVPSHDR